MENVDITDKRKEKARIEEELQTMIKQHKDTRRMGLKNNNARKNKYKITLKISNLCG